MKAVVAAFNQEKALVGAFSVIMNLRMDLSEALVDNNYVSPGHDWSESGSQDTAGVEVMPNEPEF